MRSKAKPVVVVAESAAMPTVAPPTARPAVVTVVPRRERRAAKAAAKAAKAGLVAAVRAARAGRSAC